MSDIGRLLREARESKGFSLNDAQEKTRIGVKYLSALENGQYEVLPSHTHVRGYLKNYARYLGLNPTPLLEQFEAGGHVTPDPSPLERPKRQESRIQVPMRSDPVFYHPLEMDVAPETQESSSGIWRIIGLAFIAALALIAFRVVPAVLGDENTTGAISDFLDEQVVNVVSDTPVDTDPNAPTAVPAGVSGTPTIVPDDTFAIEDDAVELVATRRPIPAALDEINLKLEITERTLLIVEIDGEEVYRGTAKKGDPAIEFNAIEEARVRAGNAVGVIVSINDIEYGRLGERGDNVEEVWQTTQANDPDAPTPTPIPTLTPSEDETTETQ